MKIALDYDDTYTRDPELWDAFIASVNRKGHTIKIVTMRYPSEFFEDMRAMVARTGIGIVFTSREAKKAFCDRNDIDIDIWIDDNPHWVLRDAK